MAPGLNVAGDEVHVAVAPAAAADDAGDDDDAVIRTVHNWMPNNLQLCESSTRCKRGGGERKQFLKKKIFRQKKKKGFLFFDLASSRASLTLGAWVIELFCSTAKLC